MQPLLDDKGIQFDARKFNWIGSLERGGQRRAVLAFEGFKTIDDAKQREMVVAGTGSGADSVIFPYILNGVLGTRFKVVTGYPGSADFLLAVERGEADGTAGVSWSAITAGKPDWITGKKINVMRPACHAEASRSRQCSLGDGVREECVGQGRPGTDIRAPGDGLSHRRSARRADGAGAGLAAGFRRRGQGPGLSR